MGFQIPGIEANGFPEVCRPGFHVAFLQYSLSPPGKLGPSVFRHGHGLHRHRRLAEWGGGLAGVLLRMEDKQNKAAELRRQVHALSRLVVSAPLGHHGIDVRLDVVEAKAAPGSGGGGGGHSAHFALEGNVGPRHRAVLVVDHLAPDGAGKAPATLRGHVLGAGQPASQRQQRRSVPQPEAHDCYPLVARLYHVAQKKRRGENFFSPRGQP